MKKRNFLLKIYFNIVLIFLVCSGNIVFGSLIYAIKDAETEKMFQLDRREIVEYCIDNAKKIDFKTPLKFRGTSKEEKNVGNNNKNPSCSLYEKFYRPKNFHEPVKLELKQGAKVGEAEINIMNHGNNQEKYKIFIEQIDNNLKSRNFIIKIKDNNLLDKTGGTFNRISGSPIMQNNKIIGFLCHGYTNDPTRAYGILGEI